MSKPWLPDRLRFSRKRRAALIKWPKLDNNLVNSETIDNLLESAKDTVKQQVEGGRAIYLRSGAILTQAATLSVTSFGAAAVIFQATTQIHGQALQIWATAGLLTASFGWALAAIMACLGLFSIDFGATTLGINNLTDPDTYYAEHVDAKILLLKTQIESVLKSRENVRGNKICLDYAVFTIAMTPLLSLIVAAAIAVWQMYFN